METNSNAESDLFSQPNPMPESSPQPEPFPEPQPAPAAETSAAASAIEAVPEPAVEVTQAAPEPQIPETPAETPGSPENSNQPEPDAPAESESSAPRSEGSTAENETPASEASQSDQDAEGSAPEGASASLDDDGADAAGDGESDQRDDGEPAATASADSEDPLLSLAARAQAKRLAPADEERAGTLLKEALMDGRAGVAKGIEALSRLPWVIGVGAVTAVWSKMKPAFRTQLFAGLAKMESDNARRMRLSLARGLFKQDIPVALKIATGVAKEIRDRETGALLPKHAQIFANVLIGRAKPWISQVPLADLKPADAEVLVHCALWASFSLPHAPITQLGILKWASENGKLAKAHPTVMEAAAKCIGRWSAKWQGALRKEVAELPEELTAVLKAPTQEPAPSSESAPTPASQSSGRDEEDEDRDERSDLPEASDEDPDGDSAEVSAIPGAGDEEPDAEDAEARTRNSRGGRSDSQQGGQKPRPVYESKTVPRKQPQPQSQPAQAQPAPQAPRGPALREAAIPDLLRAVEAQFQSLRSELQKSESKLRQKEEDLRRTQKKTTERASVPVIEGEPTPDELARLNRQLENRNVELQARIEELTADAEARAVSVGAVTDQPVEDPNTQLRTLLVLKLQEDFEDFVALEKESPDIVVQQHYRTVLRHVFEVLTAEGVKFEEPAPLP